MGFAISDVETIHIQGIGFFAPDIITFYGRSSDGKTCQLVQHLSQLSVMLAAAPKITGEPVRIGFRLGQDEA